jgi:hypothetical protein
MSGSILAEAVVLLGAGLVFVIIFRKLGLGAVLGFLIAGALIGPQGLGLVGSVETKLGVAELAIAFLLFLVGLELNPTRLWRLKEEIFGLGLAQVALCGAAVGIEAEEIDRTEDLYRKCDRERLKIQLEAGDLRAACDEVIAKTGNWTAVPVADLEGDTSL